MKEATLQAKQAVVADIVDKFKRCQSAVLIDYRGLTVEEVTNLRNIFRAQNVEYQVLKNTMIHLAAKEVGIEGLDPYLSGPTAVAFGINDAGRSRPNSSRNSSRARRRPRSRPASSAAKW